MPDRYCTIQLIHKWLTAQEPVEGKSVFEIGVYPGRFIVHFGRAGYELNGIDQTQFLPRMEHWLRQQRFKVGEFMQGDVLSMNHSRLYDVVFSAGFVEHFTNFEDIVQLHADLVKPGGYVYITAPNFGGKIQYWLHHYLDKENLDRHHVPSMDVEKWSALLIKNDFEILEAGYIGHIDFWTDQQERDFKQKALLKIIKWVLPLLKILPLPNRRSYSPECVILARKKSKA